MACNLWVIYIYIYIYIHTHGWYLLLNSLAVYLAIHDGYVMKDCMDANDN